MDNRDLEPAAIMGDLLATLLLQAYDSNRHFVDTWEAKACRWLLQEKDAGKSVGNMWMANFLELNRAVITEGHESFSINFNLRAFREANQEPTDG